MVLALLSVTVLYSMYAIQDPGQIYNFYVSESVSYTHLSPAAGRAHRLWKIERQKRRIRMKKTLKAALCAALACAMLAGCGSAPSSAAPASGSGSTGGSASTASDAPEYERATVRVAYMPNMGSGSSLITGIEMGYFDEVGLDVELTQFQGGPAEIAAMASGDIDIAQIGHGAHALCIEGQAKIFALDLLGISDEVLANTERGIETVADLKGKTIASTAGTSAEIVLDLVLGLSLIHILLCKASPEWILALERSSFWISHKKKICCKWNIRRCV